MSRSTSTTPPTSTNRSPAEIRRAIADGEAKPGERLPPAKDLAAILDVNTNTVLRSLRTAPRRGTARVPTRPRHLGRRHTRTRRRRPTSQGTRRLRPPPRLPHRRAGRDHRRRCLTDDARPSCRPGARDEHRAQVVGRDYHRPRWERRAKRSSRSTAARFGSPRRTRCSSPERGETKLDLVQHYLRVGEPLMRTMRRTAAPPAAVPTGRGRAVVLPEAHPRLGARVARDDDRLHPQRHDLAGARGGRPRATSPGR